MVSLIILRKFALQRNSCMNKYFVIVNEEQKGPFTKEDLAKKYLTEVMPVWCEGMDDWKPAGEVEELKDLLHQLPPERPKLKYIKNWLTESIAATGVCTLVSYLPGFWLCMLSLPFGGIAIWKSLKVQEYAHKHNDEMALHFAQEARKWMFWELYAFGVGVIFSLIGIGIVLLVTYSLWGNSAGQIE